MLTKEQMEPAKAFSESINEKDTAFLLMKIDEFGVPRLNWFGHPQHVAFMRLAIEEAVLKMMAQISQVQIVQQQDPTPTKPKLHAVEKGDSL
jgi:hypothetical protein